MINKSNNGFTLIELLVVVSVIGVLATVVLSSLNSARIKSKNAVVLANMKQAAQAAQMYQLDTGNWSPDVSPSVGCTPCRTDVNTPPTFVTAGYFPRDKWENITWDGKPACFDYQNWLSLSGYQKIISIDVYQYNDSCINTAPLRFCVHSEPGGNCVNDLQ